MSNYETLTGRREAPTQELAYQQLETATYEDVRNVIWIRASSAEQRLL